MLGPPIVIGREAARHAAERELSKPIYHRDDPPLAERVARWLFDQLGHLLHGAAAASPGGAAGLVVIVLVVVAAVVLLRLKLGPLARAARTSTALLPDALRSAAEHRAAADRLAAEGDLAGAVRERLRAVARELEERAVLAPRAGRTAHEMAAEAGAVLPALAGSLADAARRFDEVWYGGRAALPGDDEALRNLDRAVRGTRAGTAGASA